MNIITYEVYKNTVKRTDGFNPTTADKQYSKLKFKFRKGDDWEKCALVTANFWQSIDEITKSNAELVSDELSATFEIPECFQGNKGTIKVGLLGVYTDENGEAVTVGTNIIVINTVNGVIVTESCNQNVFEQIVTLVNQYKGLVDGTVKDIYENMEECTRNQLEIFFDEHPELFVAIPNGSITESKLSNSLNIKKANSYDTVADMLSDSKLIAGNKAKTLGYYSINDGGGAEYDIRTRTKTDKNNGLMLFTDNGLTAVLNYGTEVNIRQMGAHADFKRDSETGYIAQGTDDSEFIQTAIDEVGYVYIPNGSYAIAKSIALRKDRFTIRGESKNSCTLGWTGGEQTNEAEEKDYGAKRASLLHTECIINETTYPKKFKISDLFLNGAKQVDGVIIRGHDNTETPAGELSSLQIELCKTGVYIGICNIGMHLENINTRYAQEYGLYLRGTDHKINGLSLGNSLYDCAYMHTANTIVSNSKFWMAGMCTSYSEDEGFKGEPDYYGLRISGSYNQFMNCNVQQNMTNAMYISGTKNRFEGFIFDANNENNYENAVVLRLDNASNNVISATVFEGRNLGSSKSNRYSKNVLEFDNVIVSTLKSDNTYKHSLNADNVINLNYGSYRKSTVPTPPYVINTDTVIQDVYDSGAFADEEDIKSAFKSSNTVYSNGKDLFNEYEAKYYGNLASVENGEYYGYIKDKLTNALDLKVVSTNGHIKITNAVGTDGGTREVKIPFISTLSAGDYTLSVQNVTSTNDNTLNLKFYNDENDNLLGQSFKLKGKSITKNTSFSQEVKGIILWCGSSTELDVEFDLQLDLGDNANLFVPPILTLANSYGNTYTKNEIDTAISNVAEGKISDDIVTKIFGDYLNGHPVEYSAIADLAQYGYFTDTKAQDVFDKLTTQEVVKYLVNEDCAASGAARPVIPVEITDEWKDKISISVTDISITGNEEAKLKIRLANDNGITYKEYITDLTEEAVVSYSCNLDLSAYPTAKYILFYPSKDLDISTSEVKCHICITNSENNTTSSSVVKIDCTTVPELVEQTAANTAKIKSLEDAATNIDTTSIEALNGKENIINNLNQLAMGYCTAWQKTDSQEDILTLLHFTDIHNSANAKRISDFYADYADYIDSAICTGDMLGSRFDDSYDFWENFGCGRIMVTLGNHDVFTENTYEGNEPAWNGATTYIVPQKMCYDKFIAPYVSDWHVTQPDEIDVKSSKHYGACYYFKDYAEYKVRLFALDCMHWSTAQSDWFKTELDNAKSLGYGVVCGYHYPLGKTDSIGTTWCVPRPYERQPNLATANAVSIVSEFIDNGGEFICWLSGHYHQDAVGVLTDDNRQLDINLDCASYAGITTETMPVVGTKSQDCFTIIGFDTTAKYIKMYRVGRDTNRYMQKHEVFCWDYANGKLIFNG
jgi:hypothetical protein